MDHGLVWNKTLSNMLSFCFLSLIYIPISAKKIDNNLLFSFLDYIPISAKKKEGDNKQV
jgi:hypothetical protein